MSVATCERNHLQELFSEVYCLLSLRDKEITLLQLFIDSRLMIREYMLPLWGKEDYFICRCYRHIAPSGAKKSRYSSSEIFFAP